MMQYIHHGNNLFYSDRCYFQDIRPFCSHTCFTKNAFLLFIKRKLIFAINFQCDLEYIKNIR